MDNTNTLCDELMREIFQKLPSSSASSVSLVSKRWLHLFRSSRTSLSLHITPPFSSFSPSLISLLTHHSSLSSLSLSSSSNTTTTTPLSPLLLSTVSSLFPNLLSLKFHAGPIPLSSLTSLSKTCTHLTSLSITLPRPISLSWLFSFPFLKELSIAVANSQFGEFWEQSDDSDVELKLESLCLENIRGDDWGLCCLWRNCKNLKRLHLYSCQGIGGSYSSFVQCLQGIQHVELRTCRSVVDVVLSKLAEHCNSLESLLVHDGGSREGLLHFFSNSQCRSSLKKLDLRLPMDLDNNHLFAVAVNFRGLMSLRLQSCVLVTGEGLKAIGVAVNNGLEELALVNCDDVVEREPGILATLGQHLRRLRRLDLSHNEMLVDKEVVSMLVSCVGLVELRLRGCKGLTGVALVALVRSCKRVERVDFVQCLGIGTEAVEMFVRDCSSLRRMEVEGCKLSDAAKVWASNKFIEVVV